MGASSKSRCVMFYVKTAGPACVRTNPSRGASVSRVSAVFEGEKKKIQETSRNIFANARGKRKQTRTWRHAILFCYVIRCTTRTCPRHNDIIALLLARSGRRVPVGKT